MSPNFFLNHIRYSGKRLISVIMLRFPAKKNWLGSGAHLPSKRPVCVATWARDLIQVTNHSTAPHPRRRTRDKNVLFKSWNFWDLLLLLLHINSLVLSLGRAVLVVVVVPYLFLLHYFYFLNLRNCLWSQICKTSFYMKCCKVFPLT